jgi:hypothetical protein
LFLLEFVTVFALEPIAGGHFGLAIVVLPDLIEARFAGFAAQLLFLENVAFVVTVHFEKTQLLVPIQPVGQDDQYFPFRVLHAEECVKFEGLASIA